MPRPRPVLPAVGRVVIDPARLVHASWLPARARIRKTVFVLVEQIGVVGARRRVQARRPPSVTDGGQVMHLGSEPDAHPMGQWGPDAKLGHGGVLPCQVDHAPHRLPLVKADSKSVRDVLRAAPGAVNLAGYETARAPLAPGKKKRTLRKLVQEGSLLGGLQERLYAESTLGGQRSVLLVLQGMDTSG